MSGGPASSARFRAERLGDQAWLGPRLPPDRGRGQSFVGVLGGVRVAAFAVAPPRDARNPPGLGLALHVEPGLGPGVEAATERAVVGKAAAVAAALNLGPLHAWPPPGAGSAAAARFARLGFEATDTLTLYEVELAAALRRLRLVMTPRARERGAGFRVARLGAVEPEAALACWEACLGPRGAYRRMGLRRLRGEGRVPFDPRVSRLLLRSDRVVGVFLGTLHHTEGSDAPEVDAEVLGVRPAGAAGLVSLLRSSFEAGRACGVSRFRFPAQSSGRFSHRTAERCGGRVVSAKLQMRRPANAAV